MLDRVEILRAKTKDWINPRPELQGEIDAMILSGEGSTLPRWLRWLGGGHTFRVSGQTVWDWTEMVSPVTYPTPSLGNGPTLWWGAVSINSSNKSYSADLGIYNNIFPDSSSYYFLLRMPNGGEATYKALDTSPYGGIEREGLAQETHLQALLYVLTNLKLPPQF